MTPSGFRRSDDVSTNSPYQPMQDMLLEYENAWSIQTHCLQRRYQPTSYILPLLVSEEPVVSAAVPSVAALSVAPPLNGSHKEAPVALLTSPAAVDTTDPIAAGTDAVTDAPSTLPTTTTAAAAAGVTPPGVAGENTNDGLTRKPATKLVPCRDVITRSQGVSLSLSGKHKDKDKNSRGGVEEGEEEGRRVPFRARKKPVRGANPPRLLPPINGATTTGAIAVVSDGAHRSDVEGGVLTDKGENTNAEGSVTANDTADVLGKKSPLANQIEEENQAATFPLRQKAAPLNPSVLPSSAVLAMDG